VQVTHNPDVECYADRILYIEDGRFKRQALNRQQTPLVYEHYMKYLNEVERGE
jgi:putative ABC transport system ATP-binding protein